MQRLLDQGLTEEEARKCIEVVYQWVEDQYPVMATLAKSSVNEILASQDGSGGEG